MMALASSVSEAPNLLTILEVIIYDRNMIMIQATGANVIKLFTAIRYEFL